MSIDLVMPSNHLILFHPLLLLSSTFPSIRVFSNQFFTSGGQSIGASALASALPMNIQGWFPLELTGFISLQTSVVHHKNVIHFHLHFIPFLTEILYGYHCLSQWLSVEASQSGALRLNHTLCLTCPKILSAFTPINFCFFICKGCSDGNYSTCCICLGEKSMI